MVEKVTWHCRGGPSRCGKEGLSQCSRVGIAEGLEVGVVCGGRESTWWVVRVDVAGSGSSCGFHSGIAETGSGLWVIGWGGGRTMITWLSFHWPVGGLAGGYRFDPLRRTSWVSLWQGVPLVALTPLPLYPSLAQRGQCPGAWWWRV